MNESSNQRPPELPVVPALKALSIFSADQAGAYREHFAPLAQVLGKDVETKLGRHVITWAKGASPGVLILTGNAGTGKTAVAESYCRALGARLPGPVPADRRLDGRLVRRAAARDHRSTQ